MEGELVLFSLPVRKVMGDESYERTRKEGGSQEKPWVGKESGPPFFLWVFKLVW